MLFALILLIVLICLIAILYIILHGEVGSGVQKKVKMKDSDDLPTSGLPSRMPDGDDGSGSRSSPNLPKETREGMDESVSQIATPDLQSGENGSTIDTEADGLPHQDPVPSELKDEEEYLPGPNSIFTVKSSKNDPLAKQVFSLKRVDAFLLKYLLSEYAKYTVDEIVELAINPIAAGAGFGETEHFPTAQIETVSPGDAVIRTDVRFFAEHAPEAKNKPESLGKPGSSA